MRLFILVLVALFLNGCFKSSADKAIENSSTYLISTKPSYGGTVSPSETRVTKGASTQLKIVPEYGYKIKSVEGCPGTLVDSLYTTDALVKNCELVIVFESSLPQSFIIDSIALSEHGHIFPQYVSTQIGNSAQFVVEPSIGYLPVFSGCTGELNGNYFTTLPATDHCTVEVEFISNLPNVFVITTNSNEGGSVIPSILSAQAGTNAQLLIEANPGFVASATGCGGFLQGDIYITGVIEGSCEVNVVFNSTLPNSFLVAAQADPEGGIVWPKLSSVAEGSTSQFYITPKLGKQVHMVSGCPGSLNENVYTAGPIVKDCQLEITFKSSLPPSYIATATASDGGSISPSSASVQANTVAQFEIKPNQGKSIDSVSGCSGILNGTIYTTGSINQNCEISVSFKDTVFVSTSKNYGGDVSPISFEGAPGSSANFTLSLIDGYEIDRVIGCSGVLSGNNYAINNIQNSCTVNILFQPIQLFTITATSISNGTITPAVSTKPKGSSQTFSLTPNLGYKVASVVGCSGALTGTQYTVHNLSSDCDVVAVFERVAPPQNVAATSLSPESVRITYQRASGASSHNIYISQDPNVSSTNYQDVWRNAPDTATITNMGAGVTYYFVVGAVFTGSSGEVLGQDSARVSATTIP